MSLGHASFFPRAEDHVVAVCDLGILLPCKSDQDVDAVLRRLTQEGLLLNLPDFPRHAGSYRQMLVVVFRLRPVRVLPEELHGGLGQIVATAGAFEICVVPRPLYFAQRLFPFGLGLFDRLLGLLEEFVVVALGVSSFASLKDDRARFAYSSLSSTLVASGSKFFHRE